MLKLIVPKQSIVATGMGYVRVFYAIYFRCENWFSITWHKTFGGYMSAIILRNGTRFIPLNGRAEGGDLCMLAEIWHDHVYTPPFFDIGESDVVFDIGANNGYFSVFAAQAAAKGMVYSFEPAPQLAAATRNNVAVNRCENVVVEELALASVDGERDLFLSSAHNGCHSLFRRSPDDTPVHITSMKMEEYCRSKNIDHIDFLKLDCEGAEYEILFSLPDAIIAKIKKISMETHDDVNEHRHGELVEFLKKHNFFVTYREPFIYALNRNAIDRPA